jgi:hypothetical protein
MSKKHFEQLARALARNKPDSDSPAYLQWQRDVEAVADVCQQNNGLFNRSRFLTACKA